MKTEEEELAVEKEDVSGDYDDVLCGVGSFKPSILQPCAKMAPFVIFVSFSAFLTSALVVFIASQITTLERMFGFSSATSGFIMSCNDIGYLLCIIFATYFARRTHIPRVISICTMMYGVAGIICCVPYFLTRDKFLLDNLPTLDFQNNSNEAHLCQRHKAIYNSSDTCEAPASPSESGSLFGLSSDETALAVALITVGMAIQGFAKAPRFSYVNVYIDDNVPKKKSAFYIGIAFGCGTLGPAASFGLGGLFSRIYITLEDSDMNYRDTRWLGAWWLGFLLFGSAAMLFAIPLYFFPKHLLPKSKRLSKLKTGENKPFTLKDFKGLTRALCRLVMNPVYISLVIAKTSIIFTVAGCFAFNAKYIETQFHVPVWKADMIMGGSMILAGGVGTFIGGKVISYYRLSPTACMKLLVAFLTFFLVLFASLLVTNCQQQISERDLRVGYFGQEITLNNSTCLDDCICDTSFLLPVCDEEVGVTYYSPCHAGCSTKNKTTFSDCSCVTTGQVVSGYCPTECSMLIPFVVILFIAMFIGSFTILSFIILIMRSVVEEDKPLGLGLSSFLSNLFGWMPAPIIFGLLIDTSCLKWNTRCSKTGACAVYDIDDFRYKFIGLMVGIVGFAVSVLYFALWKVIRSNFFRNMNPTQLGTEVAVDRNVDIQEEKLNL